MQRSAFLLSVALISAAPVSALHAQMVGTYVGTTEDGSLMTMAVTESAGVFYLGASSVNFTAQCTDPSRTVSGGEGFFLGQPISESTTNFAWGDDNYDFRGALHFASNKVIKGTITSRTAALVPGDPPRKSQFCESAKQPFTLTFQTAPIFFPELPGTTVVHH
ncbi:MAG TPA: hypothetical protein VLV55_08785 [Rhizomicrobium sp.]|nr:hypothetical protein [Rhizomicrobium sp.]